ARSEEQLGASIAEVGARLEEEVARLQGDLFSRIVEDVVARHAALRQEVLAEVAALREELATQSRAMDSAMDSARRVDAGVTERLSASERRWRRVLHVLEGDASPAAGSDAKPPAHRPALPAA